jgi:hypothetical protein
MSMTPGIRAAFLTGSYRARYPEGMGGTARLRVSWDDDASKSPPGDEVDDQEALEFEATDVRPGGAFLPSELMFDQGSPLVVSMTLPGVGERVLRAEVVAVDLSGRSYGRPGMGIAFRGLAAAERKALRTLASSH